MEVLYLRTDALPLRTRLNDCFVYGFRRVMLIGVGLALASSLTALNASRTTVVFERWI